MNTKITLIAAMLAAVAITAQSCVKDGQSGNKTGSSTKVEELNIPSSFDWNGSRNITCTVSSNQESTIKIYADEACSNELLAEVVAPVSGCTIPLSISTGTDIVYLKYTTDGGQTVIEKSAITNNTASFKVTNGIKVSATRANNNTVGNGGGYIYYPAKWGTVMFEDLFPSQGDYDFNDMVLGYQVSVEFPYVNGKFDTTKANLVRLHLKLKAVGGSLMFTPYIRIVGLDKSNVTLPQFAYGDESRPNPGVTCDTNDKVQVAMVDSPLTSDVIVEFKNLNDSNPNKVVGGMYYNTESGFVMNYNLLTSVVVYLPLNEEVDANTLLDDKIDIFIASADRSKEIHLRGFNPVFSAYDFEAQGVDKNTTYATKNNLIWGLKVPYPTNHAIEKANFCNAYRQFAEWAQSGGSKNKNWYKSEADKDYKIDWKKEIK